MPTGHRPFITPADTYAIFDTNEGFQSAAKRLGTSPNTLRKWWVEKFGQEAFNARGKRLQAAGAASFNRGQAGKFKTMKEVVEPCALCGQPVILSLVRKAALARILCTACDEAERGVDRHCPVCGFGCVGDRGLAGHMARPQHGDPEAHAAYLQGKVEHLWDGKSEGPDYVTCQLCGHRAVTLTRHLLSSHRVTAEQYLMQFPAALVRSMTLTVLRQEAARRSHQEVPRRGLTKPILCSVCSRQHVVSAFFAYSTHDPRCPECKQAALDANEPWEGLQEPDDYVTCQACGYRAENLTSHVYTEHKELVGRYEAIHPNHKIVALHSAVRDKSALKGRKISDETRARMAASAGWNRGLTKETDERVARAAVGMRGRPAWSKGLTKADHPSLQSTSEKLSALRMGVPNDAARLDIAMEDFVPYLDETGAVDRHTMSEAIDVCEPTLSKYMAAIGLRLSTRYRDACIEQRIIRLEKTDLLPFALANGKIVVGAAMAGLGRDYKVIKRECERHGLPTFNHRIRQSLCLEAISKVLGGATYTQEKCFRQFCNPPTGHMFRFDGYFPDYALLAEFQGWQHWTFPSVYIQDRHLFDALIARDAEKARQVAADGRFKLLVIREDEPYADPAYLRERLLDEGVVGVD